MQSSKDNKQIALWVACQGQNKFLDSPQACSELKKVILKVRASDVFLQVFRNGKAWFPSNIFELGTSNSQLLELLSFSEQQNIKAHAWVNVCNAGTEPSEKFLEMLGNGALIQDGLSRTSKESISPFEIDTPGYWLEPSNPKLQQVLIELTKELNLLSFSGVHLDFIRYPYAIPIQPASWIEGGVDFGCSNLAIERFESESKTKCDFKFSKFGNIMPASEEVGIFFNAWRRSKIESLINSVKTQLRKDKLLSVAALAWSDRAYLNAHQDWRNWLESKVIDGICLMSYTADNKLLHQQVKLAASFKHPQQFLFAGIGLYKLSNLAHMNQQIEILQKLSVPPCYFCADHFLKNPFYL